MSHVNLVSMSGLLLVVMVAAPAFPDDVGEDRMPEFEQRDLDGDRKLSREEFLAERSRLETLISDVILRRFDEDQDGFLAPSEFRATPVPFLIDLLTNIFDENDSRHTDRNEFLAVAPDTGDGAAELQALFARFDVDDDSRLTPHEFPLFASPPVGYENENVESADEVYGRLDTNRDDALSLDEFRTRQVISTTGAKQAYDTWKQETADSLFTLLDGDENGALSRTEFANSRNDADGSDEAVYHAPGERRIPAAGFVYDEHSFTSRDGDRDERLTLEEMQRGRNPEGADEQSRLMVQADTDGDGLLQADEYQLLDSAWMNPAQEFRYLDKDHDGQLTSTDVELDEGRWSQIVLQVSVPAFDLNGDDVLSWPEFSDSPLGQPVGTPLSDIYDLNGDRSVSRDEFVSQYPPRYKDLVTGWFERFDRDQDTRLTELEFHIRWPKFVEDFNGFDTDQSGDLSVEEVSVRRADKVLPLFAFVHAKTDQDGNGTLSLPEFEHSFFTSLTGTFTKLYDANGDGVYDVGEFLQVGDEKNADRLRESFAKLDLNDDNQLTSDEVTIVAPPPSDLNTPPLETLDQAFARLDADNSGGILPAEFRTRKPGHYAGAEEHLAEWLDVADELFHAADTDGDGGLSREEFLGTKVVNLQQVPGERLYAGPGVRFDVEGFLNRDSDGDLLVSQDELSLDADNARLAAINDEFPVADLDADEQLNFEEYKRLSFAQRRPAEVFVSRDLDGDGFLTPEETMAYGGSFLRRTERLEAEARVYDDDRDGRLNYDEFRRTLSEQHDLPQTLGLRDIDEDGLLSLDEFVTPVLDIPLVDAEESRPRLEDHFLRFDRNADGFLNRSEYPYRIDGNASWKMVYVSDGRENPTHAFGRLDRDRNNELTVDEFGRREAAESTTDRRELNEWMKGVPVLFAHLDANEDGRLSLAEFVPPAGTSAPWALAPGEILQPPSGRVFRYHRFFGWDGDKDGLVDVEILLQEKLQEPRRELSAKDVQIADRDYDGRLSFEEFKRLRIAIENPAWGFNSRDQDEDGLLTADELRADRPNRTDLILAEATLRAFDRDQNGLLSPGEFHETQYSQQLGRPLYRVTDANNNGTLTFEEFVASEPDEMQPAMRSYFDRYDANDDGELTLDEFPFKLNERSYPSELAFDYLDGDRDQGLSFAELYNGVRVEESDPKTWNPHDYSLHRMQRQFAVLDTNKSGLLDFEEYRRLDQGQKTRSGGGAGGTDAFGGAPMDWLADTDRAAPPDASIIFGELDKDENGTITFKEYGGHRPTEKAVAEARKFFDRFDLDDDAELTLDEFRPTPMANPDAETLFGAKDLDHDEQLTMTEFIDIAEGALARRLELHFKRFDGNEDGLLVLDEYRATPEAKPGPEVLLATRDADENGLLEFDEFRDVPGWKARPGEISQFEWLDRNKNGSLTLAELQRNDPRFVEPKSVAETIAELQPQQGSLPGWLWMSVAAGISLVMALLFAAYQIGRRRHYRELTGPNQ